MKNFRWVVLLLPLASIILPLQAITTASRASAIAAEPQSQPKLPTPGTVIRPFLKTGSAGTEVSELQAALKLLGFYNGAVNGTYAASTATAVSKFQTAAGLKPNGAVGQETWSRLFPSTLTAQQSNPNIISISAANFPVPSDNQKPYTNTTRPATTSSKPTKPTNSKPTANKPVKPANSSRPEPTAAKPTKPANSASPNTTNTAKPVVAATPQITPIDLPVLRVGTQGPAVTRLQERLRTLGFFSGPVSGFFGPTTEASVKLAQQRYKLDPDGVVGPGTWNVLLR